MEIREIVYCLKNFAIYHAKGDLPYSKRTLQALEEAVQILKGLEEKDNVRV